MRARRIKEEARPKEEDEIENEDAGVESLSIETARTEEEARQGLEAALEMEVEEEGEDEGEVDVEVKVKGTELK